LLLKIRKYREKDRLFGKNENFRTTVITYVCLAIKWARLLLVYITDHYYPRNGVKCGGRGQWFGGTMASAEQEPITRVWGQSPQRGPWAEPLVWGSGGEAPLKLKAFW